MFKHLQTDGIPVTLKKLCATRWASRSSALKALSSAFSHVKLFLRIHAEEDKTASGAQAQSLHNTIQTFEFILLLSILERVFKTANTLSEALQKPTMNVVESVDLAKATVRELENLKIRETTSGFDALYEEATKKAKDNDIVVPSAENEDSHEPAHRQKRRRGRPSLEETAAAANGVYISPKTQYFGLFCRAIDSFIQEINKRFCDENTKVLSIVYKLIMNPDKSFLVSIKVEEELAIYADVLDLEKLREQLIIWYQYKISCDAFKDANRKHINSICTLFLSSNLKESFSELFL
jgi:hypothetical protein